MSRFNTISLTVACSFVFVQSAVADVECSGTEACEFDGGDLICTGSTVVDTYIINTTSGGWIVIYGKSGKSEFCCENYGIPDIIYLAMQGGADTVYANGYESATYEDNCEYTGAWGTVDTYPELCTSVDLGSEADYFYGSDYTTTCEQSDDLLSFDAADFVRGGSEADHIWGNGGVDYIFGNSGDDFLYGGAGQDRILGGTGVDSIWGDADGDRLCGDDGEDYLYGGLGTDLCSEYPDDTMDSCTPYGACQVF